MNDEPLIVQAYTIQAAMDFAGALIPYACLVSSIVTTRLGVGAYAYAFYDGNQADGLLLFEGTLQPLALTNLHLTVSNALYVVSAGGTQAGWTVLAALTHKR